MKKVSKINLGGQDYAIRDEILEKEIDKIKPINNYGTINNAADEEDLTTEDNLLKFKDRLSSNGMGYIILRKNKPFHEQIQSENTIYEIRYNFDLNGENIVIPKNCILFFQGGIISNGGIRFTNTYIMSERKNVFSHVAIDSKSTLSGVVRLGWFENIENDAVLLNIIMNSNADEIHFDRTTYHVYGHKQVEEEVYTDTSGAEYRKYNFSDWKFCLLLNNVKSKIFFNGATIEQNAESEDTCPVIGLQNCSDLIISDLNIKGEKLIHKGTTGQWNHGICILWDCKNITISNCDIRENYGDCICVANNANNPIQADWYATGITIENCRFGNTIRNNISVVAGSDIIVRNNSFERIRNKYDANGSTISTNCNARLYVDLEANYDWQLVDNIVISDNYMYTDEIDRLNTTGGISIGQYNNSKNVHIVGNKIYNCYYYGVAIAGYKVDSTILVENNFVSGIYNYGAIYYVGTVSCHIKNNTFHKTGLGYINNEKVTLKNGESFYFPSKANCTIESCSFLTSYSIDSNVKGCVFKNCTFDNFATWGIVKAVEFIDCEFNNVGKLQITDHKAMSDTDKQYASLYKLELENRGYEVLEDGSSNLESLTILRNCLFKNTIGNNGVIIINVFPESKVKIQETTFYKVIDKNLAIFNVNNSGDIELADVAFRECSSTILVTNSTSAEENIFFKNVQIDEISELASMKRIVDIGNIKSFIVDGLYLNVGEIYGTNQADSIFKVRAPEIATLKKGAIVHLGVYYQRTMQAMLNSFSVIDNLMVNDNQVIGTIKGSTGQRPVNNSLCVGMRYYDQTIKRVIYHDGVAWVDSNGFTAALNRGVTSLRPTGVGAGGVLDPTRDLGYQFFDTNVGKPVYAKNIQSDGSVVWVDASGEPA